MNTDAIKAILLSYVNTKFSGHKKYNHKINMVNRYINFINICIIKPDEQF